MSVQIRNVVCSIRFDQPIDIKYLLLMYPSTFYTNKVRKPKKQQKNAKKKKTTVFNAISFSIYPKTYCQLFQNGKAIVNGGLSVENMHFLVDVYESLLQCTGYVGKVIDKKIVNIVGTSDYGKPLRLKKLAEQMYYDCRCKNQLFWEPELHSAVRFRLDQYHTTVHVFHSGKIVALGGKTAEDLQSAVDDVIEYINYGDYTR